MIKSDYGHFGCPFYEERLENGLRLILIPRKSPVKTGLLYISQGGYLHDAEINGAKMPFGCASYLEKMILSEKTASLLSGLGALGTSHTDYSYTVYEVDTLQDVFAALRVLLERITSLDFTEDDVIAYKALSAKKASLLPPDPEALLRKRILEGLYFQSPISLGYEPDSEEAVSIHASAMKKFLTRYYIARQMMLMIAGDFQPSQVKAAVAKLPIPGNITTTEKEFFFNEDYSKVRQDFASEKGKSVTSHLAYGIKFPKREKLYEKYGQMLFQFYEILPQALYAENEDFQLRLSGAGAYLEKAELVEGGEDTSLLLTLGVKSANAPITALTDYHAALEKRVSHTLFESLLEGYTAEAFRKLALPNTAVKAFVPAYANNLPYTSLAGQTSKLSFRSFRGFLKELSSYPKAAYLLER